VEGDEVFRTKKVLGGVSDARGRHSRQKSGSTNRNNNIRLNSRFSFTVTPKNLFP